MIKNGVINKLLTSYRLFSIVLVAIIAFVGAKFALSKSDLDFNFVFSILCILIVAGFIIYEKSIKNPIFVYIPLQLILATIFVDAKFAKITGFEPKLYALAFLLAFLVAVTFLFKYFKWLWSNFLLFRCFFIFFIINLFYFTFYHTDFREWSTYYFNNLQYFDFNSKVLSIEAVGLYPNSNFSETKQVGMYLGSIVPVIASVISIMIFHGLNTTKAVNDRFCEVIKYITLTLSIYLGLAILSIPLGISSFLFIFDGRFWSDFLGIAGFSEYYIAIFIIMLVGFKYYINNNYFENKSFYNILMNIGIITFFGILCLFIVKATLIALSFSLAVMFFLNKKNKQILGLSKPLICVIVIGLIFIIAAFSTQIAVQIEKISTRFSDLNSLNMRTDLWTVYIQNWLDNLTIFNILFGHGIDASRELAFKIAFMEPSYGVVGVPHIHNAYLEVFYDYGMMGLLYIGTLVYIGFDNLRTIFSDKIKDDKLKLACSMSLTILLYTSIYYTAEVFRIPAAIVLFSSLGMLESLKYVYKTTKVDKYDKFIEQLKNS